MVVGVAVRQNHCPEVPRIDPENVEVVNREFDNLDPAHTCRRCT